MVDITEVVLLAASFFFVVLSVALLVRYRQVSERLNASADLGRDLWSSLEQRLKKQDERILDMMGRVEVMQARATTVALASAAPTVSTPPVAPPAAPQTKVEPTPSHSPGPPAQQPRSQPPAPESHESQASRPPAAAIEVPEAKFELDETQLAALRLLSEAPKNTRQLTDSLAKSREHTARIMKALFESGLVKRNDSAKPFVYELTDEGRSRLSP